MNETISEYLNKRVDILSKKAGSAIGWMKTALMCMEIKDIQLAKRNLEIAIQVLEGGKDDSAT